ncbi:MAG TPA: retroviral-like aspartic protease family protein [Candidatus Acidoferrales bacterium]|jgi:hypothetical protein|nr:retroviral-like aspartic protease family protein [Candidatus Acidoferrales bacterium]
MRSLIAFLGLLFLCACAMGNPLHARVGSPARLDLPSEIDMNKDAGRGGWIIVNVRVAGQELPFFLDTGATVTCIDKSLEPQLGKRYLTMPTHTFVFNSSSGVYAVPPLYLGKTLLTDSQTYVMAMDCSQCSQLAGRPVMGILGIDVLQNYCFQLDFAANKLRFLDDQHLDTNKLGTAFPLKQLLNGCYYLDDNLVGARGPGSVIDVGENADGWLVSGAYQQWTHPPAALSPGEAASPNGMLGGKLYTHLTLRDVGTNTSMAPLTDYNGLGLRFFARNLVTLDFPHQMLYLKQTSAGPFVDKKFNALATTEDKAALKYLAHLKSDGLLPGWPYNNDVSVRRFDFHFLYPDSVTVDLITGTSSAYHYQVFRPSKKAPWQIQRAWLTDAQGNTIKEFPLP